MMKKGYARGGMKKKGYAAGGVGMKKKMMSRGGKMPMATDPTTGKKVPAFAMDGVGKMAKGGNMKKKMMSAGGNMKKKMYASRGTDVSSDYTSGSITKRKYPGAGVRAKDESKDKAVTPAMIKKAGITGGSAKQRLNAYMNKFKMEGGKYVKRKNILRSSDPKVNEMLGIGTKTVKAKGKGTSPKKVILRGARAVKGPGEKKAGESNFERLLRENRAAIAKSGGKSGRLKKDK
tara:strand:+ start:933 stop:1631 length:699 start_codon:yes stop_codon:yes gene_type:complete